MILQSLRSKLLVMLRGRTANLEYSALIKPVLNGLLP